MFEALVDSVQRRDAAALGRLYAEDAVLFHPLSPEPLRGREAIRASDQILFEAFPDVAVEVRSVLGTEEQCAGEVVIRGTNTGPLDLGDGPMEPTGRRVAVPAVWWVVLRDGLIVEERDYMDALGFTAQLGISTPG